MQHPYVCAWGEGPEGPGVPARPVPWARWHAKEQPCAEEGAYSDPGGAEGISPTSLAATMLCLCLL